METQLETWGHNGISGPPPFIEQLFMTLCLLSFLQVSQPSTRAVLPAARAPPPSPPPPTRPWSRGGRAGRPRAAVSTLRAAHSDLPGQQG